MFVVMCRVSGGVTGTRTAELKDKNGQIAYFETRKAADDEAKRLRDYHNAPERARHATASFHYWSEEA